MSASGSKEYMPFVEDGVEVVEEAPGQQARRWSAWSAGAAAGLLVLGAWIGTRHLLQPANVKKAISLQGQGYDWSEIKAADPSSSAFLASAASASAGSHFLNDLPDGSAYTVMPAESVHSAMPAAAAYPAASMPLDWHQTNWYSAPGVGSDYVSNVFPDYTQATHHVEHVTVVHHHHDHDHDHDDHDDEKTYSCKTSSVNQPSLWEKERREWCCLHAQVACPSWKAPYSCKAEAQESLTQWSPGKKEWCCDHFAVGCHKEPPKSFDCKADAKQAALWSDMHKAWCCHREQVGCPLAGKYTCEGSLRSWSAKKKAWCCAKSGKACEKHFDCKSEEKNNWSEEEHEFCCASGRCGPKYDCDAGYSHWQTLWTSSKQEWCCSSYGRACPTDDAYDCSHSSDLHGWSESKIMWCCQHRGLACGAQRPFDCMAGGKWREGWSAKKKSYCCEKFELGCRSDASAEAGEPQPEEVTEGLEAVEGSEDEGDADYDCTAGIHNWRHGWSKGKKGWCCKKYKLGCGDDDVAGAEHVHHFVHGSHAFHFGSHHGMEVRDVTPFGPFL